MNLPNRRKLGATALVIAALGAFLVPFLMHSNAKPASPTAPGGGNGNTNPNPNSGGTTTPTTPTTPSGDDHHSSGGGTSDQDQDNDDSSSCATTSSSQRSDSDLQDTESSHTTGDGDHQGNGNHNGNAFGLMKNKLDTTIALVEAMGAHNPAFQLHHSTDTDNDAGHSNSHGQNASSTDGPDSDCATTEKDNEND